MTDQLKIERAKGETVEVDNLLLREEMQSGRKD